MGTAGVTWSPRAIREAIRTLHDAAIEAATEGLDDADVARVLGWQSYSHDEAADLLWLAIDKRHLLPVSRMRIDPDGVEHNPTTRYFAFGRRP